MAVYTTLIGDAADPYYKDNTIRRAVHAICDTSILRDPHVLHVTLVLKGVSVTLQSGRYDPFNTKVTTYHHLKIECEDYSITSLLMN